MPLNSLRARLLLSTALLIAVVLPATAFVLVSFHRHALERAFDARLEVHLDNLIAVSLRDTPAAETDAERPAINLGEPLFERPFSGWYWQIRLVGAEEEQGIVSDSLLDQRLPAINEGRSEVSDGDAARGYATGPEQQRLRVVEREIILAGDEKAEDVSAGGMTGMSAETSAADAGGETDDRYLFAVAAPAAEVEQQIVQFRNMLLLALGILGAGLIGAAMVQVRFGLRPLAVMSRRLNDIRTGKTDRLDGAFPREIEPLQAELNALLRANRDIVERARTHVGNLAHALKTPLSVVANEIDRAREQGGEQLEIAELVDRQVTLMKDHVRHHLDRARMAAQAGTIGTATEVEPVLQALARTLQKINQDRPVALTSECAAGIQFRGERQDLEEMLGNLLDNAFKWARSAVRVAVHPAADRPGFLTIDVEDDGPGLSADKRQQAVRRGQRLDEAQPGSGLGLAIVADLVHLYGGSFALEQSPIGGLRAILLLPREGI